MNTNNSERVSRRKRNQVTYLNDSTALIHLSSGNYTIVDEDVAEMLLDKACWFEVKKYKYPKSKSKTSYIAAYCRENKSTIQIHRIILGIEDKDIVIDHINGSGFDNRRCNLRICSKAENGRNTSLYVNNKSGVKGVSWAKRLGKWMACIQVNNKSIHLGYFLSIEEAAIAVRHARLKYHGTFANHGEYAGPKVPAVIHNIQT
jgi:hypothetical protein